MWALLSFAMLPASAALAPRLCRLLQRRARAYPAERFTGGTADRESEVRGRQGCRIYPCGRSSPPLRLAGSGIVPGLERRGTSGSVTGWVLSTNRRASRTPRGAPKGRCLPRPLSAPPAAELQPCSGAPRSLDEGEAQLKNLQPAVRLNSQSSATVVPVCR